MRKVKNIRTRVSISGSLFLVKSEAKIPAGMLIIHFSEDAYTNKLTNPKIFILQTPLGPIL